MLSRGSPAFLVALAILTCSCWSTTSPLPTLEPRPAYIREVGPPESGVVDRDSYAAARGDFLGVPDPEWGYASHVCVSFDVGPLVQDGDDLDSEQVRLRTDLEVDGVSRLLVLERSVDSLLDIGSGPWQEPRAMWGGPYARCWYAPLDVGVHTATFRFRQTSGEIQEYSWLFEINEE